MGTLVVLNSLGSLERSTLDRLKLLWARPEDFFTLGGDSLMATGVDGEIR